MSIDEQSLSEELEKLESISGRKADVSCDHNPFQKKSKCNGKTGTFIWPAKCHCPYIRKPQRGHTLNKKFTNRLVKQATLKYPAHYHQSETKLDDLYESLPVDIYDDNNSEKSKQGSCNQQTDAYESDISIYELASYFEILVDIPKQMSTMAEMMYM